VFLQNNPKLTLTSFHCAISIDKWSKEKKLPTCIMQGGYPNETRIDHYARMLFKMGVEVLYNGQVAKVTGWSTNGDAGEATTYSYQLNGAGDLVQETDLTLAPIGATGTDAPTESGATGTDAPTESGATGTDAPTGN
jgi:hypothetical protein